jgi:hypothetical protein
MDIRQIAIYDEFDSLLETLCEREESARDRDRDRIEKMLN